MGLSTALNNSYSGLVASSRRAEVTSHNIANATTEGFARREVELASRNIGGVGLGVLVSDTVVSQTPGLTAKRREEDAAVAYQQEIADATKVLSDLIGDPDDESSLFNRFDGLEESLRALSDAPQSTQAQSEVLTDAKDVAQALNDINDGLLEVREDADTAIARQVDELNNLLNEFAELNADVRIAVNANGEAAELIAQRELLIDQISSFVSIETIQRDTGDIALMTEKGLILAETTALQFEFTQAGAVTSDMDLVGGSAGALSTLTIAGTGTDVTPSTDAMGRLSGGSLEALFEVRDVVTVEFQTQVDALAQDLVDRFEAVSPTARGIFQDTLAVPTTEIDLGINLPTADTATAGNVHTAVVEYFDATGASQQLTMTYTSTGTANEWTLSIDDSASATNPISTMTLLFHSTGANAGYLDLVTAGTGDAYNAGTGELALLVNDDADTITIDIGLEDATTGFLTQTTDDFSTEGVERNGSLPGLAGRLTIAAEVDPEQGGSLTAIRDGIGATAGDVGDNTHAIALLDALTSKQDAQAGSGLSGKKSLVTFIADYSSVVVSDSQAANNTLTLRIARQATYEEAEVAANGVDMDRELQELTMIETAYSANARVMQVVNELFDTLLEI